MEIPDCVRIPDKLVTQSVGRNIFGFYGLRPLVGKVFRPERTGKTFPDLEGVLGAIKTQNQDKVRIREIVQALGSDPDQLVPESQAVVYARDNGLAFAEFQPWFEDARPLSTLGLEIFNLDRQALIDLKNLYLASLLTLHEKGSFLDLFGSRASHRRYSLLINSTHLPFFSENIIIDKQGRVRFVDATVSYEEPQITLRGQIRRRLQEAGSHASILFLDTLILAKTPALKLASKKLETHP